MVALKAAQMSSSSYHDTLKRNYQQPLTDLIEEIRKIRQTNPDYGHRTVTLELCRQGKIAPNSINRRFKTDRPFQKVVTDVTEMC